MSLTPIFDQLLAESDPDIFLAGNIFPKPTVFAEGGYVGPATAFPQPSDMALVGTVPDSPAWKTVLS